MYYVYELINLMGGVDYVGHSDNPKKRLWQHTKAKPNGRSGNGKFYGRQDISLHIVSVHETKAEARREEVRLQKFWGFETEVEKMARSQRGQKREKITGENHGRAKLTNEQVREIKFFLRQGISTRKIAKMLGVNRRTITFIKTGKAWTSVE